MTAEFIATATTGFLVANVAFWIGVIAGRLTK